MKVLIFVRYTVLGALLLSAASASATDQQQDQLRIHADDSQYALNQDQVRLQDQDHVQLQTQEHKQNRQQVYGAELMTPEEQAEYSKQYSVLQSDAERKQFRHEHQLTIQQQAQAAGIPKRTETTVQLQNKVRQSVTGQSVGNDASMNGGPTSSSGMQHGGGGKGGGGRR